MRLKVTAIKCDLCGEGVDVRRSYVSWWFDVEKAKTLRVWLTCQPYNCESTAKLERTPAGVLLMDHHVDSIAARFVQWAKDYDVPPEAVAKLAMRISPLLEQMQAILDHEESLNDEATP